MTSRIWEPTPQEGSSSDDLMCADIGDAWMTHIDRNRHNTPVLETFFVAGGKVWRAEDARHQPVLSPIAKLERNKAMLNKGLDQEEQKALSKGLPYDRNKVFADVMRYFEEQFALEMYPPVGKLPMDAVLYPQVMHYTGNRKLDRLIEESQVIPAAARGWTDEKLSEGVIEHQEPNITPDDVLVYSGETDVNYDLIPQGTPDEELFRVALSRCLSALEDNYDVTVRFLPDQEDTRTDAQKKWDAAWCRGYTPNPSQVRCKPGEVPHLTRNEGEYQLKRWLGNAVKNPKWTEEAIRAVTRMVEITCANLDDTPDDLRERLEPVIHEYESAWTSTMEEIAIKELSKKDPCYMPLRELCAQLAEEFWGFVYKRLGKACSAMQITAEHVDKVRGEPETQVFRARLSAGLRQLLEAGHHPSRYTMRSVGHWSRLWAPVIEVNGVDLNSHDHTKLYAVWSRSMADCLRDRGPFQSYSELWTRAPEACTELLRGSKYRAAALTALSIYHSSGARRELREVMTAATADPLIPSWEKNLICHLMNPHASKTGVSPRTI